jgi:hypothetical protein
VTLAAYATVGGCSTVVRTAICHGSNIAWGLASRQVSGRGWAASSNVRPLCMLLLRECMTEQELSGLGHVPEVVRVANPLQCAAAQRAASALVMTKMRVQD